MVNGMIPLFVTVIGRGLLGVPTFTLPKLSCCGLIWIWVPIPWSRIICCRVGSLSTTTKFPNKVLVVVIGAADTEIVQLAPPESPVPQLFVCENSPTTLIVEMLIGWVPVFVKVAVCAADLVPVTVVGKLKPG